MGEPKKTGRKQDGTFDKGHSGNPAGRPKGSLNGTTIAAQQILDSDAEKLTRKAVQLALEGNLMALRICLDRILPRRSVPIQLDLGSLSTTDQLPEAFERVIEAMAKGKLSASELSPVIGLLDAHMKLFELIAFEKRLQALEDAVANARL